MKSDTILAILFIIGMLCTAAYLILSQQETIGKTEVIAVTAVVIIIIAVGIIRKKKK